MNRSLLKAPGLPASLPKASSPLLDEGRVLPWSPISLDAQALGLAPPTPQVQGGQTGPRREPGRLHAAGRPGRPAPSTRLYLTPGPTGPPWSTPSAAWGFSSTC